MATESLSPLTIQRKSPCYSLRIEALRSEMIRKIPKVPNTKETLKHLSAMSTNQIMIIFLTWRMRFVSARPREVKIWSGGVDPADFISIGKSLKPLLIKVKRGDDLTPHLSDLVNTLGYTMPTPRLSGQRNKEIDHILTKTGLYHFHVGKVSPKNPKGRSGKLVFADVSDAEFRIIAISNHDAFDIRSNEWSRLFEINNRYIGSQLPKGTVAYMLHPTMVSGHSLDIIRFADYCENLMVEIDACLDDPIFIDKLYNGEKSLEGQLIARPQRPKFRWRFNEKNFGLYESKTGVFFQLAICPR